MLSAVSYYTSLVNHYESVMKDLTLSLLTVFGTLPTNLSPSLFTEYPSVTVGELYAMFYVSFLVFK